MTVAMLHRLQKGAGRFATDQRGASLIEFALAMPLVLGCGMWGLEMSNYAIANLKVSQVALNLADNASRVGVDSGLSTVQLREVDINDVLQGARLQGSSINLGENARVTLTSLENRKGEQRIHWQRCLGKKQGKSWASHYGSTTADAGTAPDKPGTLATSGMGPTGAKVNAPPESGVMFVEINYNYKPLMGTMVMSPTRIHYIASFIVRDRRDFTQLYNPEPQATLSTCNKYTA